MISYFDFFAAFGGEKLKQILLEPCNQMTTCNCILTIVYSLIRRISNLNTTFSSVTAVRCYQTQATIGTLYYAVIRPGRIFTSWLACIAPSHEYNLTYRYEQALLAGDVWPRGRVAGNYQDRPVDNYCNSPLRTYVQNLEFRVDIIVKSCKVSLTCV